MIKFTSGGNIAKVEVMLLQNVVSYGMIVTCLDYIVISYSPIKVSDILEDSSLKVIKRRKIFKFMLACLELMTVIIFG